MASAWPALILRGFVVCVVRRSRLLLLFCDILSLAVDWFGLPRLRFRRLMSGARMGAPLNAVLSTHSIRFCICVFF